MYRRPPRAVETPRAFRASATSLSGCCASRSAPRWPGRPVSDLLVAHPNVASESGLFPRPPCLSDPGGRVPRRKCHSSKSPKLNPLGGSSTSGEGMTGPFPKFSIERKTASGSLVSLASRHNPAKPNPAAAEPYQRRPANDRTTSDPSVHLPSRYHGSWAS